MRLKTYQIAQHCTRAAANNYNGLSIQLLITIGHLLICSIQCIDLL